MGAQDALVGATWQQQLRWSLFKNFKLKRRSLRLTVLEILIPVLIVILFAVIKTTVHNTKVSFGTFDDLPVPSMIQMQAMRQMGVQTSGPPTPVAHPVWLGYGPATDPNVQRLFAKISADALAGVNITGGAPPPGASNATMTLRTVGFAKPEDIVEHVQTNTTFPLWCAVWFPAGVPALNLSAEGGNVTQPYEVRCSPNDLPNGKTLTLTQALALIESKENKDESSPTRQYVLSGFMSVQAAVDAALCSLAAEEAKQPDVGAACRGSRLRMFPRPDYTVDTFAQAIQGVFSMLMVMTFMITVRFLVSDILVEKEKRIREALKIMGLRAWVNWASWGISSTSLMFVTMTIVCIVFKVGKLFPSSDFSVLWLFYLLFMIAVVSYAFLLTTFFSKARTGGIVSMLAFMASSLPSQAFQKGAASSDASGPAMAKLGACVLAPTAFSLGNGIIAQAEVDGLGVTWANLHKADFPLSAVMLMLLVDIVLYLSLAWYLDKVIPGEFGAARHPLFLCSPSYWRGRGSASSPGPAPVPMTPRGSERAAPGGGATVEPEDPARAGQPAAVQVRGLCKTFPSPDPSRPPLKAVDELSLDMHSGDVFCLLGHNGAGKTTTISMLTGLTPPTAGDAFVFGHSVVTDIDSVRAVTGFCPQHDILFDRLTVLEHLRLFAGVKGVPATEVDKEAHIKMAEVGLTEKRDTLACELSGGMKRKLSVALAFIGGSKVVYLDEPCSGIDPFTRRLIWALIEKNSAGRVIVLTTHSMDEADLLGDRIAIMSKGRLRCAGGSLFLKANFGIGYNLTVLREPQCDQNRLTATVLGAIPGSKVLPAHAHETTYVLPLSASPAFPDLLDSLDRDKQSLGLESYGISVTTLEEVFLSIAREDEEADAQAELQRLASTGAGSGGGGGGGGAGAGASHNPTHPDYDARDKGLLDAPAKRRNARQQFKALVTKRALTSKRDKRGFYMQLFMPCFFMMLGAILVKTFPKTDMNKGAALNLSPFMYGSRGDKAVGFNSTAEVLDLETAGFEARGLNYTLHNDTSEFWQALALSENEASVHAGAHRAAVLGGGPNATDLSPTLLYSVRAAHVAPAMVSALSSACLSRAARRNITLNVTNNPLPRTPGNNPIDVLGEIASSILSFYIVIGLAFVPAIISSNAVKERESKAKHQQLVSGVNRKLYWLSSYVWDVALFGAPLAFALSLYFALGLKAFTTGVALPGMALLLVLYGLAVVPLAFSVSFAFNKHQLAQTATLLMFLFGGLVFIMVSYFLTVLGQAGYKTLGSLAKVVKYPFFLLPNYAVGKAMLDLSFQHLVDSQFVGYKGYDKPSPLGWSLLGAPLTFLFVEIFLYWALALYLEDRSTRSARLVAGGGGGGGGGGGEGESALLINGAETRREDDDVAVERHRVEAQFDATGVPLPGQAQAGPADMVSFVRLRKVYPPSAEAGPKVAVRNLSFGIAAGECFGLLGPNGAGKTTALGMLTGDLSPTSGTAWLGGYEILSEFDKVCDELGFCPQQDALLELLTPREHLTLYARIKGLPEPDIPRLVESMLAKVDLLQHAHKLAKDLSGGNKRKLSLGNALIGDPNILSVDEASTGVDPMARRKLWDVISEFQRGGRAVVLTTHSLEEADALCSRIAIMVDGELKCLGSSQHLKNKLGQGYNLEVNLASPAGVPGAQAFFATALPDARIVEAHGGHLKIEVPTARLSLASIFRAIESNKASLGIREFSVSQPTLEQIFIRKCNESME